MNYKIAQLILTPSQRISSTSEVFVAQPDAHKETLAGKIFALIEIETKRAEDLKVINFLINNLTFEYYQNEKMLLRERMPSLKVEHIFESALAKTNKKLAEFLQNEKIKLNQNLINLTVGVIYKNQLHFTNLGKNKALLIYKNKAEIEQAKYKLANITEQTKTAEFKKPATITKLFSSVVSGSIPAGSYFLFTNETLPEYLSTKELIEVITTLPPTSAMEQIKNLLEKINLYVPFLAILIKNTTGEPAEIKVSTYQPTTQTSIQSLNLTEEATEKLLTPSGLINFKNWFAGANKFFSNINPLAKLRSKKSKQNIILLKKPADFNWFTKFFKFFKNLLSYLARLIIYLFQIFSDRKKLHQLFSLNQSKFKSRFVGLKNNLRKFNFWFKNLNKKNQLILTISLICLFIFMNNSIWLSWRNKEKEKQSSSNQLIQLIEQKQNQIDASLLYNNEAGAKKLLDETTNLTEQLPRSTAKQKSQYKKFLTQNTIFSEKINHLIKIDTPLELANLINLNSQADPKNLIKVGKKIYLADNGQKSIYSLEIESKIVTAITEIKPTIIDLNFPVTDGKNKIYYLNSTNLIGLNSLNEEISQLSLALPANLKKIAGLTLFNNRLYFLDSQGQQIYRLSSTNNGFGDATSWLSERVDLTQTVSLDIDGNIYLLKTDGLVLKFARGKKQDFNLAAVEPALSATTKLIVSLEQKYLYLLEPKTKRLVVFDKTGKFLVQYLINQFNDLKDFIVDETAKKIYFLNKTSVYLVEAQHFEK